MDSRMVHGRFLIVVVLSVPAAAGAPKEEMSEVSRLPSAPTPDVTALANPFPTLNNIDDCLEQL
jgi:hypothetical protein